MRVAIGSDHAGFELKEILIAELNAWVMRLLITELIHLSHVTTLTLLNH